MQNYKTAQELFWSGDFGNEYIKRNQDVNIIGSNTALFASILKQTRGIQTVIEFGANIGMNIHALKNLLPYAHLSAIEINENAVSELKKIENLDIFHESIFNFNKTIAYDFVFSKGVLIHLEPTMLPYVYKTMYETSQRYICVIEYYNPTPVEINYRGFSEKMYKRDFAGELMDTYPDLQLIDYGFAYHRDPVFAQGDLTWFLMEKRG